jgi:hypothetical protein
MNTKLCSYILRADTGLAPNPFWGVCTVAVCTPNHQGSRLDVGDWIAGFLEKKRGHKFLYAMEISEILGLDEYFRDPRFAAKKPNLRGSWQEQCGDNFYSRSADGAWLRHRNRFHLDERSKKQDTKHARVFIGERFWYLGRSAAAGPEKYAPVIGGRGARVNHDPALVADFCAWVAGQFEPGVCDLPIDNPDVYCNVGTRVAEAEAKGLITALTGCSPAPRGDC